MTTTTADHFDRQYQMHLTMGSSGLPGTAQTGVSVREAWQTSKSAHGPWRVSQTPALSIALPLRFFEH